MPHDLPKAYDPTAIEDHWAEYWVKENLFAQPTPNSGALDGSATSSGTSSPSSRLDQSLDGRSLDGQPPFVILLPPPNVTGRLHMGHMLNQTEMDILTR